MSEPRPWPPFLARLLMGGLFLWAGIGKAFEPGAFLAEVQVFSHFREASPILILSIPILEILLGCALLIRLRPKTTWLLVTALLGIFTVWILWGLVSGEFTTCGCFGKAFRIPVEWALIRNGILLTICWLGWQSTENPPKANAREG